MAFYDLGAVLGFASSPQVLAGSALLEPAQVPWLLEGRADDVGVWVRERQSNSVLDLWRQGVHETGTSWALFMVLGL